MENINNQRWKELTSQDDNKVILDVRTDEEVADGIIPNSIQLDIYQPQEFMDGINAMDKTKTYYIYCRSGGRSAQACQIMEQAGFERTYNLEGGYSNWDGDTAMPKS
ncbi:rhodanese-like domain-containing protein [Nonlabens ponticola]|uniref:Rhodanese-like domain-containing protein n=1 Tax=Nonlabens ponticola TaxID=2496866 RepID=A0A3S9N0M6_9FLAO|nr:rhodanese-like domain-containing protein [Nonlabens ponticola]AZQ44934.1 rhodanese-like domain-containing protein [Nonlabens ponticola]